jgi:dCTP deaminase
MILSDRDVRFALKLGHMEIEPYDPACLQPASYDCHLGRQLLSFPKNWTDIDPQAPPPMRAWTTLDVFRLQPQEIVLYELAERLRLPADMVARVEGKSSLARLGLTVHLTAGYVDPGWDGVLTLELKNEHAACGILLRPGMKIAQLSFHRLSSPAERPYGSAGLGSHYQGSDTVVGSRYDEGVA